MRIEQHSLVPFFLSKRFHLLARIYNGFDFNKVLDLLEVFLQDSLTFIFPDIVVQGLVPLF